MTVDLYCTASLNSALSNKHSITSLLVLFCGLEQGLWPCPRGVHPVPIYPKLQVQYVCNFGTKSTSVSYKECPLPSVPLAILMEWRLRRVSSLEPQDCISAFKMTLWCLWPSIWSCDWDKNQHIIVRVRGSLLEISGLLPLSWEWGPALSTDVYVSWSLGVLFTSGRKNVSVIWTVWCGVSRNAGTVSDRCGKEGAEPVGNTLSLPPVCGNKEITDTGSQNEFPRRMLRHAHRDWMRSLDIQRELWVEPVFLCEKIKAVEVWASD